MPELVLRLRGAWRLRERGRDLPAVHAAASREQDRGPCKDFRGYDMCPTVMAEVCDENGKKLGSNKCSFCTSSKGQAYRGTINPC